MHLGFTAVVMIALALYAASVTLLPPDGPAAVSS
jgi:hypothetical protein